MNGLLWIAQLILAALFLCTGAGKLFAYERAMGAVEARSKGRPAAISRGLAAFIGLAEIAGALGVVTPAALTPAPLVPGPPLVRLGAWGRALIMWLAGFYPMRRQ